MKNIVGGLLAAFLILCGVIGPASAALPDAAYAGPLWDRIVGGASCVVHTIHNPEKIVRPDFTDGIFGGGHLRAGQYVYWDAVAKRCVTGGAVAGPGF
jgi:hypothetical protein